MNCTLDAASCHLFNALVTYLLNPAMLLLTGLAGVIFLWGLVEFLWSIQEGAQEGTKNGKQHMLWGIIGLFIMVGAYGILVLIQNTVTSLAGSSLR